MLHASVGSQIQAVIAEADERVARAVEEGQARVAEALAESGEFAAKAAAKHARALALAVEEAERRGMAKAAQGAVTPSAADQPIPRAASNESLESSGKVNALRAEVQMLKGALAHAQGRISELEDKLQKKKSARENQLEEHLREVDPCPETTLA